MNGRNLRIQPSTKVQFHHHILQTKDELVSRYPGLSYDHGVSKKVGKMIMNYLSNEMQTNADFFYPLGVCY